MARSDKGGKNARKHNSLINNLLQNCAIFRYFKPKSFRFKIIDSERPFNTNIIYKNIAEHLGCYKELKTINGSQQKHTVVASPISPMPTICTS